LTVGESWRERNSRIKIKSSKRNKSSSKRVSRKQKEEAECLASIEVTPRVKRQKNAKPVAAEVETVVEEEVREEVEEEVEEEVKEEVEVEEGEEKSKSEDEDDLGKFTDGSSKSGDSQNGSGHDSQDCSVNMTDGHKRFRSKQNREFDATKHGCGAWRSQNDVINTLTERL
jgi:hypothetical protein